MLKIDIHKTIILSNKAFQKQPGFLEVLLKDFVNLNYSIILWLSSPVHSVSLKRNFYLKQIRLPNFLLSNVFAALKGNHFYLIFGIKSFLIRSDTLNGPQKKLYLYMSLVIKKTRLFAYMRKQRRRSASLLSLHG